MTDKHTSIVQLQNMQQQ